MFILKTLVSYLSLSLSPLITQILFPQNIYQTTSYLRLTWGIAWIFLNSKTGMVVWWLCFQKQVRAKWEMWSPWTTYEFFSGRPAFVLKKRSTRVLVHWQLLNHLICHILKQYSKERDRRITQFTLDTNIKEKKHMIYMWTQTQRVP